MTLTVEDCFPPPSK